MFVLLLAVHTPDWHSLVLQSGMGTAGESAECHKQWIGVRQQAWMRSWHTDQPGQVFLDLHLGQLHTEMVLCWDTVFGIGSLSTILWALTILPGGG